MAVIPANVPGFDPIDLSRLERRLFFDVPAPHGTIDKSLRAYIETVSYGQARFEADILNPVTAVTTDDAFQASPAVHNYENVFIVFNTNDHEHRRPYAEMHKTVAFRPPRPENRVRNYSRASMNNLVGVWAHEITHMLTGITDLYGAPSHPGDFDNMACACGTHPSSYTKLKIGWISQNDVPIAVGGRVETFVVRALALRTRNSPAVAAVRIPSAISDRYFLVEVRLKLDVYEQGMADVSAGIPSEGIVVFEIDGNRSPPVMLRTPIALAPGDSFSDPVEKLEITNANQQFNIFGTAAVVIKPTESAGCSNIRDELDDLIRDLRELQDKLRSATPAEKPGIMDLIRQRTAQIQRTRTKGRFLGCRLS